MGHYPNAPITEAIIDLRVELPNGKTVVDLEKVRQGLESAYPNKKKTKLNFFEGQFRDEGAATAASSRHTGFLFASQDGKYIFQARLDGFTMSRLAPYESWEPFRDEARRLWSVYRAVAVPARIIRVAVRYLNRLDLPLPVRNLKDYLRTVPEVSDDLPQELAEYFMQLHIPLNDIHSHLLINQTIIEPAKPGVASVVLDIDVFRKDEVPLGDEGIWGFFETLHERKNKVFEACITDQARELFK